MFASHGLQKREPITFNPADWAVRFRLTDFTPGWIKQSLSDLTNRFNLKELTQKHLDKLCTVQTALKSIKLTVYLLVLLPCQQRGANESDLMSHSTAPLTVWGGAAWSLTERWVVRAEPPVKEHRSDETALWSGRSDGKHVCGDGFLMMWWFNASLLHFWDKLLIYTQSYEAESRSWFIFFFTTTIMSHLSRQRENVSAVGRRNGFN